MKNISNMIRSLKKSKKGQTLVEYALILAFIAVVSIVVMKFLGTTITSKFSEVSSALTS